MVEDKDVTVFVVVTDDAVDVSLIKSLLSSEGDARVVICTIVSTEDDEGDGEGSRRRYEKLPIRVY
jgi:hypothetical protein